MDSGLRRNDEYRPDFMTISGKVHQGEKERVRLINPGYRDWNGRLVPSPIVGLEYDGVKLVYGRMAPMIPLRLSLRNFLCYRENVPTLDFSGLHVACLCGANGHGKSALLDAITWALWGKARGTDRRGSSLDDLISYAADEMRVELDFQSGGNSYRVIRSHARGGARRRRGDSDLQLQVLGEGGALAINGNTTRETQAKIEQAVGLDYGAFINSAFLLQGRADEFSNKAPTERKEVLAKILGLDVYDRLQILARERLQDKQKQTAGVEALLAKVSQDLQEIGDPSVELTDVNHRLGELNQQVDLQQKVVADQKGRGK